MHFLTVTVQCCPQVMLFLLLFDAVHSSCSFKCSMLSAAHAISNCKRSMLSTAHALVNVWCCPQLMLFQTANVHCCPQLMLFLTVNVHCSPQLMFLLTVYVHCSWQCMLFLTGNVCCSPHHIYGKEKCPMLGLHAKPTLTLNVFNTGFNALRTKLKKFQLFNWQLEVPFNCFLHLSVYVC